jgi:tripartite-type tricarboxylate transporter receptor subunit TctC
MKHAGRALFLMCLALASFGFSSASAEQAFPTRPIKLIVPFAAGGGIDLTARIAAQKASELLGQQIVVINQGGAGGAIGTEAVVKAPADGYTFLYHSTSGVVYSVVTKDVPYDWMKDLAPVSLVTRFAPVIIVPPSLGVSTVHDFVALVKAHPGKYSYGSSGTGTAVHLAEALIVEKAGLKMLHVPYRGTAAVMPDLLAGRIAMLFDGVPAQMSNIKSGSVKAIAVTTEKRSPALPNIPTLKESGIDVVAPFWTAIYAPTATPKPIIEKVAAAFNKAMHDPDVKQKLRNIGTEGVGSNPSEANDFNRKQFEFYRAIIQNNPTLIGAH